MLFKRKRVCCSITMRFSAGLRSRNLDLEKASHLRGYFHQLRTISQVRLLGLTNELSPRSVRPLVDPLVRSGLEDPANLHVLHNLHVLMTSRHGWSCRYGIMTFIMTAAPLSMHVHDGFSIEDTAGVIRNHVIAMYAPSLISAFLIERFGVRRMMALGVVVFSGTMAFAIGGREIFNYTSAMVLLGIGWSFLYIGGTTLLVTTYRKAERFKAQAVNDFCVFCASALGSLFAGTVLYYLGWTQVIVMSMPLLLIMAVALFWTRNAPPIEPAPDTA